MSREESAARRAVAETQRRLCADARKHEDDILAAAELDTASEHLRAVAGQIRDHRAANGAEHAVGCSRRH